MTRVDWIEFIPGVRDYIIARLSCGDITREEAEAWAARNHEPPFVSTPDTIRFDPMAESLWTLAMAAAWIIYGNPESVREHWDAYRFECTEWRKIDKRRLPDGRVEAGWEVRRREGARVHDVLPHHTASRGRALEQIKELWNEITAGRIEATGLPHTVGGIRADMLRSAPLRIVIPRREFADLSYINLHNGLPDSIATATDEEARYDEVRVWRDQVLLRWGVPSDKSSIAAATRCRKWLNDEIKKSPDRRPRPKSEYREQAMEQFDSLSGHQFNKQWDKAIEDQNAVQWRRAGRPRKQSNHETT